MKPWNKESGDCMDVLGNHISQEDYIIFFNEFTI